MHELKEITEASEDIFRGKLLHVKRDAVRMPDGSAGVREWIDHPGAAAIVAMLDAERVVMVRQYRYGPGKTFLELPAGKFDGPEAPEAVAARELEEETGYRAGRLEHLGGLYNAVGYSNEIIHIYLATDLERTHQALDEGEVLEVEIHALDEVVAMAGRGELQDMKTVSGLLMAAARLRG
ncbi:MAG: NUDIX hydrolase [Rhodothermales bacterium]|nr:NUDIX hydrolase [Rhodothermales bacterium]MBO6780178.1 NUDIX hydrolase [Rhodothermales bacterium]